MLYKKVITVWRADGETNLLDKFFMDFTYNSIKLTEEINTRNRLVISYKTRQEKLKDILDKK